MEINYLAVLVCGIFSMILGALWYGPLFGKKWGEIVRMDMNNPEEVKKMKRGVGVLYLLQFLLTLFQVYVLAHYIKGWNEVNGIENALWIFFGFILPTLAANAMWNNDSRRIAWLRFGIQFGYQFILFVVFGFILGVWQ